MNIGSLLARKLNNNFVVARIEKEEDEMDDLDLFVTNSKKHQPIQKMRRAKGQRVKKQMEKETIDGLDPKMAEAAADNEVQAITNINGDDAEQDEAVPHQMS